MEGKSVKLVMVPLAWCEYMMGEALKKGGLRQRQKVKAKEGRYTSNSRKL